jgi:methylenetetrahydrofolate dehydrogenase (NADP+)/methenyltetrahydrofolate cyclohydrolase
MSTVVDGKKLAAEVRAEVAEAVKQLGGAAPCLATVLVGEDPASQVHVRNKHRACRKAGMNSVKIELDASIGEAELLDHVERLNADPKVNGILVQLPLPEGIDENRVALAIDPDKDVDGLHPTNAGRLLANEPGPRPGTPLGILAILDRYKVELEGARAVVIGRSEIVGKPIALLLLHRNATVTMCHSRTRDLPALCREADVLVVAIGRPRFVRGDWIKPGAAVIDVGVNRLDEGLVGDVDFDSAAQVAGLITPVPGGVGPLTIAMVLKNTLRAYELQSRA